jgi:hypothetical protein
MVSKLPSSSLIIRDLKGSHCAEYLTITIIPAEDAIIGYRKPTRKRQDE